MHAMPPERETAKRPVKTDDRLLPAAFRSALGSGRAKPPTGADPLDPPSGGLNSGPHPSRDQKIKNAGPARNHTMAPRKGHR